MNKNIEVLRGLRERLVRINRDTDGDNHINESCDALDELDAALAAMGGQGEGRYPCPRGCDCRGRDCPDCANFTAPQQPEARELLARAIPHLRDAAEPYEDDGSNEPLELAREIEDFMAAPAPVESPLSSASLGFDGVGVAATTPPPSAVLEVVGWLHEVVWEDGTAYSFYRNQPGLLGPRPGLVSERIGRAAFIAAAAPKPEEG